jgi:osmotically-inducible protein OsmY
VQHTFFKHSGFGRALLMCLLIGFGAGLGGCASAVIGAGATAGTAAMQERGFKTAVSDTAIHAEIDAAYLVNKVHFLRVAIDVHEGRVLLTGSTPKPKDRIEAVRLAWTIEGVKEVINEISVRNSSGLMDAARDHWVSAKLRVKLTFDSTIHAINYTIDTVNGTVYLLGIAQDAAELQRVRNHARALDYVRRVISHVRVKS